MNKIKYFIVIDTEFVSSKEGAQPFQISMIALSLRKKKLTKISDFNVFIMLREGLKLNYFAKKHTGITEEKLKSYGIFPDMAVNQVVNFLANFNVNETMIVGWAVNNDKRMLDKLINFKEKIIDLDLYQWYDLSNSYQKINKFKANETPSLKTACDYYRLSGYNFHDAEDDARATALLLSMFIKELGFDQAIKIPLIKQEKEKAKREKIKKLKDSKKIKRG
jgi:DNA polymerase III epsilon subunit-like protein